MKERACGMRGWLLLLVLLVAPHLNLSGQGSSHTTSAAENPGTKANPEAWATRRPGTIPQKNAQKLPLPKRAINAQPPTAQPPGPQPPGPQPPDARRLDILRRLPPIYAVAPAGFAEGPHAEASPDTESLPTPRQLIHVPLVEPSEGDNIKLTTSDDRISLTARDAPLSSILAVIAEQHGLNIVTGDDVTENITLKLTNVQLEDALNSILESNGYSWTRRKDILIVSRLTAEGRKSPATQGRQVRVFTLNYVTASDVDKVVQGLLSPVGQSFVTATVPTDLRRTREQLVVEDLPEYLCRVESYLAQADIPPKQVLIEAHVLQVLLKDNCRHGVNLREIIQTAHGRVTLSTEGLAAGLPPSSSLRIEGTDLTALLEAIKSSTDAKTLASPKIAVLNNQEAQIQVGSKIGYLLTTTTQTSTLESVSFLDVGVILKVTPSITEDGQVMIQVKPQVSTGRINPATQLPESETNEVDTRVLLGDGEALVIGGLIKETDSDSRTKVPFLGDLRLLGWLFRRSETTRERSEIIVALMPRILPDAPGARALDPVELHRAGTPLLYGPLVPVDRTLYEPKMPETTLFPNRLQGGAENSMPSESFVPYSEAPPAESGPMYDEDPLPPTPSPEGY